VVHEQLLEDHSTDGLRSGEGGVARLHDGGITWSVPRVLRTTPDGVMNIMSVSLLGLTRGRVACVNLCQDSETTSRVMFMTADADAQQWTKPRAITGAGYHVVNNDRLIQLANGRLLIPVARDIEGPGRSACGCLWSDDEGQSWHMGAEIRIQKQDMLPPRAIEHSNADAVAAIAEGDVHCQEPGVIELADGRVMLWSRTTGSYCYRAYSSDGGQTWGPFRAIPEFNTPCSPQSIRRLGNARRMVMLLNDRGAIPYGHLDFFLRRPLLIALSDDDGATWRPHGLLEPESVVSNCYYSICEHGENVVFTYYEGTMGTDKQGRAVPRNLASLKVKIIKRKYFEL
jgi:sialidase-1